MKGEIMPQLMQKPLFLDLKSLLWSGSQICCELIRVSLCSINHLQGHIEKRVHPDRPENPVATEERTTTTIKNTLWKVMNRPSNTEVETDTPIWSLVCSTYQTKDHFTKIGIVLFNLGKKTSPTTRLRQILPFTSQGSWALERASDLFKVAQLEVVLS